ncbi:hypothetical protein O6H91_13G025000 [Diphasiastrum complanatum]|uniref:Uncharacterized protein n=1 Tax=Diphasiastrum complanatum TaxID=34168 RepID=A0ACC2BT14_DIPCM|nr:hypothetical protein O6H91_13G025000 [Diphasiastrum complanatum]
MNVIGSSESFQASQHFVAVLSNVAFQIKVSSRFYS